jgi:hypothetical protein
MPTDPISNTPHGMRHPARRASLNESPHPARTPPARNPANPPPASTRGGGGGVREPHGSRF